MTEPLGLDDYLETLETMKKSRRDRIGRLGELGIPVTTAIAGGLLAWWIGAASFFTAFGYTFLIVSNPIGWVIGGATVMGALGYFFAKLARSGGKYDTLKNLNIRELEQRIHKMRTESKQSWSPEPKMRQLISSLQLLVANGHMSQDDSTNLIAAIENKHVSIDVAFKQIQDLVEEKAALEAAKCLSHANAPLDGRGSASTVTENAGSAPGGRSRTARFGDTLISLEKFATLRTAASTGLLVGLLVLAYRVFAMTPADRTNWEAYNLPLATALIWFVRVTVGAYAIAVVIHLLAAITKFLNRALTSIRRKGNSAQQSVQRKTDAIDRRVSSARAVFGRTKQFFTRRKKPTLEIE